MRLQLFLLALLLASTAVHEAGHWLAGKAFGYRLAGVRWIPPGVHLRGPRGPNGIAPPQEAILIALGGPMASFLSFGGIWASGFHACAILWALAGVIDILAVDGFHIVKASWRAICG